MDRALHSQLESEPILQTAAEWFFELSSESVRGERIAEWQQWLAQNAAHRDAFARIEALWRMSDDVGPAHWPTDAEVAQDSYSGAEDIATWRARQPVKTALPGRSPRASSHSRSPRLTLWLTAAASVAILSILGVGYYGSDIAVMIGGGSRIYVETQVGETRTLTLPDGSVLSAGGQTSLVATFFKHSRTVTLRRGEAFFHVAKDRTRPFAVEAGSTSVIAVGTAFDVRRNRDRVVVAVAEGIVRVAGSTLETPPVLAATGSDSTRQGQLSGSQLKAGQRLSVDHAHSPPELTSIDSKRVAGWREGRLQYLNEPLDVVVADLARYSARKIVVEDPEVAALRVTGVVFEQNIDAWFASVEATLPVRVVKQSDGSVSLERR
jgi:transmembrane sensor